MAWQLVHHFLNDTCPPGVPLTRRGVGSILRRRQPTCPVDHGSATARTLAVAITELLHRRGIEHDFGSPSNSMLYCLGGPELYRRPDECDPIDDSCVDLLLNVCDEHQTISLELYPYDLVPEMGSGTPEDPRRSEPIELEGDDIVAQVTRRTAAWLDGILVLPR